MNKNYNIIVTGGSGFIGTNLVEYLIDKKYKVVNIDKCSYSSVPEKFKFYKKDRNYKFIKANLTNEKKIEKIFKLYKPRFIFNLAAESHVDRSIDYPKKFLKSNINSSISLLEVLRKFKQKKILKKTTLIHLSTDEVYGSNLQKPSNENDLLKPNSPYSSSKASVDNILRAYLKTYKMPIIIVRCCNNFGPYQFPEKFIPTIVLNLLNNKRVPIYGSGKNIRAADNKGFDSKK